MLAELFLAVTAVEPRIGIFWLQPDRLAKIRDGLFMIPQPSPGFAPVKQSLGKVRADLESFIKIFNGLPVSLARFLVIAVTEQSIGIVRLQLHPPGMTIKTVCRAGTVNAECLA